MLNRVASSFSQTGLPGPALEEIYLRILISLRIIAIIDKCNLSSKLDLGWCRTPEIGLPEPDAVIYMDRKPELSESMSGYGEERYEKLEFQKRVYENYKTLGEGRNWISIDCSSSPSIEECQNEIEKRLNAQFGEDMTSQNEINYFK